MSNFVKDGTGNGYLAGVDSSNRLLTAATVRNRVVDATENEKAFIFSTGLISISTSEALVARLVAGAITTAGEHLHVENLYLSYNGGDTNHNRAAIVRFYAGTTSPTANYTEISPNNLYMGSSVAATASSQVWDGVGTGMTVTSNGLLFSTMIIGPGLTVINSAGSIIMPKDQIVGMTVEAEEAGDFALTASYFLA